MTGLITIAPEKGRNLIHTTPSTDQPCGLIFFKSCGILIILGLVLTYIILLVKSGDSVKESVKESVEFVLILLAALIPMIILFSIGFAFCCGTAIQTQRDYPSHPSNQDESGAPVCNDWWFFCCTSPSKNAYLQPYEVPFAAICVVDLDKK